MSAYLVKILADDEQREDWFPKFNSLEWSGAYVQTELAHGSDVQSIGTLATFDEKTQEFILHTPNVESIKWWPGDLGLSATHGVIMARLISKGVDHGVYPFLAQLRDLNTHHVLPGIEIGDIGPKLGYASKDNGFARFTNFRIPKRALLAKYYKIKENGDFEITGNPKIIYASMMESRTALIDVHITVIFRAICIATRYSILRKQFKDSEGKEIRIIDYQLQKYKLMKYISRTYAMSFSRHSLVKYLKKSMEKVKQNNFEFLQESHVLLC